MLGEHGEYGAWSTMLHGTVFGVVDSQGGPRGANETFSESMLMAAAHRRAGAGQLTLRAMVSLDPLMGKAGYPLLLQTGETADGHTPLIDRQHPHDFVMELATRYSLPLTQQLSTFIYAAYPGEPALGPPTFMHRFAALANPEAPITHHWLDSTHISFGVFTAGLSAAQWQLELSVFNGREPDQFRWNFDPLRLDSYAARLSWNPTPSLAVQWSYGTIHSPEQLTPDINVQRATTSVIFDQPLGLGHWQSTLAWGRNRSVPTIAGGQAESSDAFMIESALVHVRHTVFTRAEHVAKGELFVTGPLVNITFEVARLSLGYLYDMPVSPHLALGIGVLGSAYRLPPALSSAYSPHPHSYMMFVRVSLK